MLLWRAVRQKRHRYVGTHFPGGKNQCPVLYPLFPSRSCLFQTIPPFILVTVVFPCSKRSLSHPLDHSFETSAFHDYSTVSQDWTLNSERLICFFSAMDIASTIHNMVAQHPPNSTFNRSIMHITCVFVENLDWRVLSVDVRCHSLCASIFYVDLSFQLQSPHPVVPNVNVFCSLTHLFIFHQVD